MPVSDLASLPADQLAEKLEIGSTWLPQPYRDQHRKYAAEFARRLKAAEDALESAENSLMHAREWFRREEYLGMSDVMDVALDALAVLRGGSDTEKQP